jgi:hypothetical protein
LTLLSGTAFWILLCAAAFIWLAWLLRRDRLSLGLPIAYMISLLLIHVPGAFTPLLSDQFAYNADIIEIGIRFTAIGCLCFVGGVYAARSLYRKRHPIYLYVERRVFWHFCLIGGLVVAFGLSFLGDLPSVRSALDRGAMLWTLGVLLALRYAFSQTNIKAMISWGAAALIYPFLILLVGFLSYGSAAMIIVVSALVISLRSPLKLIIAGTLTVYLGLSVFVNYFAHRTEFREIAWSGASTGERVSAALGMFSDFHWFDPTDDKQLSALDIRLNQNYFVGLAALRIDQEQVSYLNGRSIWEGLQALVPRALWPDKPVYGGSGTIVADMTGLRLNEETSWGVGNVMEFEINFGTAGVIFGFLILGFALGWLDYKAAAADARGDIGKLILFFLVGVALTQPGASIVEMAGGAASAAVAAYIWKWLWQFWLRRSRHRIVSGEFVASR